MGWDHDDIEAAREQATGEIDRGRIELRRERTEAARRNVAAFGALAAKLRDHALAPVASAGSRVGQVLPWLAMGVAAGSGLFLVYLALRRGGAPRVVVVPPGRRRRRGAR